MGNEFSRVWEIILHELAPGTSIPNWTVLKGNLGDMMEVIGVDQDKIIIKSPKAKKLLNVTRDDFEQIWEIWPAYKAGRVKRQEIRDMSFHSKYILSTLHWLEDNKL